MFYSKEEQGGINESMNRSEILPFTAERSHVCSSLMMLIHVVLVPALSTMSCCHSCFPVFSFTSRLPVLTPLQSAHLFLLWTSQIKCHPYLFLHLILRGNKAHSAVSPMSYHPLKCWNQNVMQSLLLPKRSLTSIDSNTTDNSHTSPPSFGRRGKKPQSPEGQICCQGFSFSSSFSSRTEKMTGLSTVSHLDSWETCCMCFLLTEGWRELCTSCQQVCQCFTGKVFIFVLIRSLKHATSIRPWQRPRKHSVLDYKTQRNTAVGPAGATTPNKKKSSLKLWWIAVWIILQVKTDYCLLLIYVLACKHIRIVMLFTWACSESLNNVKTAKCEPVATGSL